MKKVITLLVGLMCFTSVVSAQNFKFGHLNAQEIIYLMPEMDSARVVLEKYGKDLQSTLTSMQNEYSNKITDYQQMSSNWTPVVLKTKQTEIQEMQQRIQKFQQSASQDIQTKQNTMFAPIYEKASEAIKKIGKTNGFTYIFDLSSTNIPFVNESVSIDVSDLVKKELGIPLDKKLPEQGVQGNNAATNN
ncbi:MAG: OmpH family outer membrane protein [Bacteroidales bacterium]